MMQRLLNGVTKVKCSRPYPGHFLHLNSNTKCPASQCSYFFMFLISREKVGEREVPFVIGLLVGFVTCFVSFSAEVSKQSHTALLFLVKTMLK